MQRAIKGKERIDKLAAKLNVAAPAAADGCSAPKQSMWDVASEAALPVPTLRSPTTEHDKVTMDLSKPLTVTGIEWARNLAKPGEGCDIKSHHEVFRGQFAAWQHRSTHFRSGRKVKDVTVAASISEQMLSGFPQSALAASNAGVRPLGIRILRFGA